MRHVYNSSLSRVLVPVLTITLFLGGCAGTKPLMERPVTLEAVNHALAHRSAVITLVDGRTIRNIVNVKIDREHTSYVRNNSSLREEIATPDVRQISVASRGNINVGTLVGATPGLIIAGVGLIKAGDEPTNNAEYISAVATVGLGAGIALLGGVFGFLVGQTTADNKAVVVYEGPIDHYPD